MGFFEQFIKDPLGTLEDYNVPGFTRKPPPVPLADQPLTWENLNLVLEARFKRRCPPSSEWLTGPRVGQYRRAPTDQRLLGFGKFDPGSDLPDVIRIFRDGRLEGDGQGCVTQAGKWSIQDEQLVGTLPQRNEYWFTIRPSAFTHDALYVEALYQPSGPSQSFHCARFDFDEFAKI